MKNKKKLYVVVGSDKTMVAYQTIEELVSEHGDIEVEVYTFEAKKFAESRTRYVLTDLEKES